MRDASPLTVDVAELLRHPGSTKRLRAHHEAAGFALPLARVPEGTGLVLDLRMDSLVEGIHVEGTVAGSFVLECRRCLTDVVERRRVAVDEVFLHPGSGQEGETYEIRGEEIHLGQMLRDALMLALPLDPLCREDCRGLCPTCGADRNTADCGHGADRVDIRWGPLGGLRERMEE